MSVSVCVCVCFVLCTYVCFCLIFFSFVFSNNQFFLSFPLLIFLDILLRFCITKQKKKRIATYFLPSIYFCIPRFFSHLRHEPKQLMTNIIIFLRSCRTFSSQLWYFCSCLICCVLCYFILSVLSQCCVQREREREGKCQVTAVREKRR